MTPLHLFVSPRFQRAYQGLSTGLQLLVDAELHEFERRYVANPSMCLRAYDRVEGGRRGELIEFDVAGAKRMIGHWRPGCLTLLDVGGKAIVSGARNIEIDNAIALAVQAPAHFHNSSRSLLLRLPEKGFQQYANELAPDWVYFLDREQTAVEEAIYRSAVEVLIENDVYAVHFIVGGPGTGKTSIVLNILKRLADEGEYAIRLHMSKDLRDQLQSCMPIDFTLFVDRELQSPDIVLVDDPDDATDIARLASAGREGSARLVVVAFDPVQLDRALPDRDFESLVTQHSAAVHELHTCYRQKHNVGLATKRVIDVIAESTPYLDSTKIAAHRKSHMRLTALSNELTFPNPIGHVAAPYYSAQPEDLHKELRRIASQPGGLWSHTTPLLIALIDDQLDDLPHWFKQIVQRSGIRSRIVKAKSLKRIKGLEYQHAFIVASADLLAELDQGFSGTGRRLYEARRLLRIPFSRAKDSLAIFGIGAGGAA